MYNECTINIKGRLEGRPARKEVKRNRMSTNSSPESSDSQTHALDPTLNRLLIDVC